MLRTEPFISIASQKQQNSMFSNLNHNQIRDCSRVFVLLSCCANIVCADKQGESEIIHVRICYTNTVGTPNRITHNSNALQIYK